MFGLFKKKQQTGTLTDTIRLIKRGQEELLPHWIKQFGTSDVFIISKEKDNPANLLVLGPEGEKNYIAVFTDREALACAVRGNEEVLFPITINGKALIEQANVTGRGLIINPTDETATVPLPARMMAVFLDGLRILQP